MTRFECTPLSHTALQGNTTSLSPSSGSVRSGGAGVSQDRGGSHELGAALGNMGENKWLQIADMAERVLEENRADAHR